MLKLSEKCIGGKWADGQSRIEMGLQKESRLEKGNRDTEFGCRHFDFVVPKEHANGITQEQLVNAHMKPCECRLWLKSKQTNKQKAV